MKRKRKAKSQVSLDQDSGTKKSKTGNKDAQVFVLPPNLLQKLGISLENVGSTQSHCKITSDSDQKVQNIQEQDISKKCLRERIPEAEKESSITDTAQLMKKSVFLSPTFLPIMDSVTVEVEITKDFNNLDSINSANNCSIVQDFKPETIKMTCDETEKSTNYNLSQNDKEAVCNSKTLNINEKTSSTNIQVSRTEKINSSSPSPLTRYASSDDHQDEAYLSDCSNSNLDTSDQISGTFDEDAVKINDIPISFTGTKYSQKKVNIISQEVVTSSELLQFKQSMLPTRNNLSPIAITTLLTKKLKANSMPNTSEDSLLPKIVNNIEELTKSGDTTKNFNLESDEDTSSRIDLIGTSDSSSDIAVKNVAVEKDCLKICDFLNKYSPNASLCNIEYITEPRSNHEKNNSHSSSMPYQLLVEPIGGFLVSSETHSKQLHEDPNQSISSNQKVSCDLKHSISLQLDKSRIATIQHLINSSEITSLNNNDKHKSITKGIIYEKNNIAQAKATTEKTNTKPPSLNATSNKELLSKEVNPNAENISNLGNETKQSNQNTIENNNEKCDKYPNVEKEASVSVNFQTSFVTEMKQQKRGLIPKMCVQGIEKPGGKDFGNDYIELKFDGSSKIKTYRGKIKNKCTESKQVDVHLHCEAQEYNDNYIDIPRNEPTFDLEYCLCSDFGSLSLYGTANVYQHVHFLHAPRQNCDLFDIFGIYSEDSKERNQIGNDNTECFETQNTEVNVCNNSICWSTFVYDAYDEKKSVQSHICEEIESICEDSVIRITEVDQVKDDDNESNKSVEIITCIEIIDDNVNDVDPAETSEQVTNENSFLNTEFSSFSEIDMDTSTRKDEEIRDTQTALRDPPRRNSNKHKISTCIESKEDCEEPTKKKAVRCGVCNIMMTDREWEKHLVDVHCHVAWKEGDTFDIESKEVQQKLKELVNIVKKLTCSNCIYKTSSANNYLRHFKNCMLNFGPSTSTPNKNENNSKNICKNIESIKSKAFPLKSESVKCRECKKKVKAGDWVEHIQLFHNYLATNYDESVLDLKNVEDVSTHLKKVLMTSKELKCNQCDFIARKNVKSFMKHVKNAHQVSAPVVINQSIEDEDSGSTTSHIDKIPETGANKDVSCGVCEMVIQAAEWVNHIQKDHNYLAWKKGEPSLDLQNEATMFEHLNKISKQNGELVCGKCGIKRKYPKPFLRHIQTCVDDPVDSEEESTVNGSKADTVCGVCKITLKEEDWINHIKISHNYLAWRRGQTPIKLDDDAAIFNHYLDIIDKAGVLSCGKCSANYQSIKLFMKHVNICTVPITNTPNNNTSNKINEERRYEVPIEKKSEPVADSDGNVAPNVEFVICGVCTVNVDAKSWHEHLYKVHNYMAWTLGEQPVDLTDKYHLQHHLYLLSKQFGGLKCSKCGISRKYVERYLQHIATCQVLTVVSDDSEDVSDQSEILECAVCAAQVPRSKWKSHAMDEHYNVAYAVGQTPIDIRNPYVADKYIKEYLEQKKRLVCKMCNITRASNVGFYAHVITCGKTEEEIARFQDICDICNSKYLCIYKSQHIKMHRDQALAKERKKQLEEKQNSKAEDDSSLGVLDTSIKRRAAVKAQNVIENYNSNTTNQYKYNCPSCDMGTDSKKKLASHKCEKNKSEQAPFDSDAAADGESSSEEESDDESGAVSDASVSDDLPKKRKSFPAEKVSRMIFTVRKPSSFISQGVEEYQVKYLTNETLYPAWRTCKYEPVPASEFGKYTPALEESCNIKIAGTEWIRIDRFQAYKKSFATGVFVGSSIRCVAWVPQNDESSDQIDEFLAVAAYLQPDTPRIDADVIERHAGLIQIWNFGNFDELPKFVLGIAHDLGSVWSLDWCPSGARDAVEPVDGHVSRLGLLATACSDGSAYIFSVPYPHTMNGCDKRLYKLKPVAELRLSMSADRKKYQATSVRWSPKKDHSVLVVGYSDGCTAMYDLETDSPFLKTTEDDLTVLYPYHDERTLNNCITDVDLFAGERESWLVSCGAATGARVCARGAGRGARAGVSLPACAATFLPHWPAAMLAADVNNMSNSVSEVDWFGGRRAGAARACAGCGRCARVAVFASPALRLLQLHPAYKEIKKEVIASIDLAPLDNKISKKANDELSVKLEPIEYEQAVKKYGVVLKPIKECSKSSDSFPERFPLADVPSLAFCRSQRHHTKLAIATHAGIIFLIDTET